MVDCLALAKDSKILEPCAGEGVFIEEIFKRLPDACIDAFELNQNAVEHLKKKFCNYSNITISATDTLLDESLDLFANLGGIYDRIIANPPYGAWQDYEKRKLLKHRFNGLYVKETYTLFLHKCLMLLKEEGILTFIIPDTFLSLHLHKAIRNEILTQTKIHEIALFPSSFFPGVNFGYSNLCIITLEKCSNVDKCLDNSFSVISDFESVSDLSSKHINKNTYNQKSIYQSVDHAFMIKNDTKVVCEVLNEAKLRVGDIADCVTGFYSGNDKLFLRALHTDIHKNSRNYSEINIEEVYIPSGEQQDLLDGLAGKKHFVPIVKGGSVKFYKPDIWFMDWSKEAVKHYKNDSKARFQNSSYYFKSGIGVPMVSSRQISASLIENQLFDQSIVGIFPKNTEFTFYLLALFNSTTYNTFVRAINPSANNSANYLKKVPFIIPNNDILDKINIITNDIITKKKKGDANTLTNENELNTIINGIYNI